MTGTPEGNDEGLRPSEFAGVGLQLAVCIIGGLYLGQWLDRRFSTAPWMLFIGVFGGAALGIYSMYRKLMAAQAREEAAKARRKSGSGPA
jgi:F0F1-type ATP synthase assembly protein I